MENLQLFRGERWLPNKFAPKVVSLCVANLVDATVSSFIDQENRSQKVEVIDTILLNFEAEMVKKIPLSDTDQLDQLFWPFNPTGEYSVKSRYKFLQQEAQNLQPGQSNTVQLKPLWKAIWSLSVPSKVRNLVWGATKNSLPTKTNLVKQKIINSSMCESCQQANEDVCHALFHCPKLSDLWNKVPLWNHDSLRQATTFLIQLVVFLQKTGTWLFFPW